MGKPNLLREIAIAVSLGTVGGLAWKTWHVKDRAERSRFWGEYRRAEEARIQAENNRANEAVALKTVGQALQMGQQ